MEANEIAIVVATEPHLRGFAARLSELGFDVEDISRQGLIVALDAATLMSRFLNDGHVDAGAFHSVIGGIVQRQAETGHRVRIFGEMVSLLWDGGDVVAAIELEALWNDLARIVPFSLLCAYRADSVLGAGHAKALEKVCALHSSVLERPLSDLEVSAQFMAHIAAPREARHFVIDLMRRWGYAPDLVNDAALVVTELAANAVVHAASTFTVVLRAEDEVVHLAVEDSYPVDQSSLIVRPGRGLGLVASLSRRWGVNDSADGKRIWAEVGSVNL